jgi:hypothetical protein
LGLSRIEVSSINYIFVSLGEARKFRSKGIDRLSSPGSDLKRNGVVKER